MSYPGTHKEESDDSDESIHKDEMEEKLREAADQVIKDLRIKEKEENERIE